MSGTDDTNRLSVDMKRTVADERGDVAWSRHANWEFDVLANNFSETNDGRVEDCTFFYLMSDRHLHDPREMGMDFDTMLRYNLEDIERVLETCPNEVNRYCTPAINRHDEFSYENNIYTPLHYVTGMNETEEGVEKLMKILRLFYEKGTPEERLRQRVRNEEYNSIHLAAKEGNVNVLLYMLDKMRRRDPEYLRSAVNDLASISRSTKAIDLALCHGTDPVRCICAFQLYVAGCRFPENPVGFSDSKHRKAAFVNFVRCLQEVDARPANAFAAFRRDYFVWLLKNMPNYGVLIGVHSPDTILAMIVQTNVCTEEELKEIAKHTDREKGKRVLTRLRNVTDVPENLSRILKDRFEEGTS